MPKLRSDVRQEVLDLYEAGLTLSEVAQRLGISEHPVREWVRDAGLTRARGARPMSAEVEAKRTAALADLDATDDPIITVARRHGLPASTLRQWHESHQEAEYKGGWVRDGLIWRPTQPDAA